MSASIDDCAARLHVSRRDGVVWIEGGVTENREHKHHALQLTWASPGSTALLRVGDREHSGGAVVVDGGVTHALCLENGFIALIDSASSIAERIRIQYLKHGACAEFDASNWDGSLEGAQAWLGALEGERPGAAKDARIEKVLAWLDAAQERGDWSGVSLGGALGLAHLSRGRFLHLFSAQVGSPWRTYLVWRRALVAAARMAGGGSVTEAAHAAGYSDAAHLSRQFSSLFGVTPSSFAKNSHFVQSERGRGAHTRLTTRDPGANREGARNGDLD